MNIYPATTRPPVREFIRMSSRFQTAPDLCGRVVAVSVFDLNTRPRASAVIVRARGRKISRSARATTGGRTENQYATRPGGSAGTDASRACSAASTAAADLSRSAGRRRRDRGVPATVVGWPPRTKVYEIARFRRSFET